jgi:hypothetical protein
LRTPENDLEVSLPTTRDNLVGRIAQVIEANKHLETVLVDFRATLAQMSERVSGGETAVDALRNLNAPVSRRLVTESLEEFESARRQMRVAIMALALSQGSSISDVAKVLGISRQLASRLAAEIDR